jgi:hypothetical protein
MPERCLREARFAMPRDIARTEKALNFALRASVRSREVVADVGGIPGSCGCYETKHESSVMLSRLIVTVFIKQYITQHCRSMTIESPASCRDNQHTNI